MANPSLQIGNSNWAIKEDNLLGYSTAGTRFVPQPITMTRASAGTRVNSSGLVETVELLGSEEVTGFTNGTSYPFSTFTTSGSNITSAIISSSFAGAVSNSISIVNGKTYKVTFTYTKNSGDDLRVLISSSVSGAGTSISNIEQVSASGDITLFFTATSTTTGYLQMGTGSGSDSLDISITNISVKESTKNNLARVDYDGTASSLLVEPQRTNLIPYSEDFSQYTNSDTTDTANTVTSPDGTVNGTTLTASGSGSLNHIITSPTYTIASGEITSSIFAKKGTVNYIRLRLNGTTGGERAWYNLNNGTIDGEDVSSSAKIEDYGNGWYRCSLTSSSNIASGSGKSLQIFIQDSGGSQTAWTANGTENIYIWGTQTEQGSYGTSYIPNFGTALGVTRVQDQYSKTGISNLINSEEGVLFVEMAALSDDETNREITLSDGIGSNYVLIRFNSGGSNRIYTRVDVGGALEYYDLNTSHTITNNNKIAIRWGASNFATFINGVEAGSQLSGSSFSADTLTELNFDNGAGGGNFYGKVKQLQVFKTADIDLAALTS